MICDDLKFIFIDICKTAGTSINKTLHDYIIKEFKCEPIGKHHSIKNIVGDFKYCTNISKDQIDNYFKFTIVRNPWDRIVSLWFWGLNADYKNTTFKQFVLNIKNKKYNDNNYSRYVPMLDWITDNNGNIMVDFIGRYETLEHDFEEICNRLHFPKLDLVKINTARDQSGLIRKHYSHYYDDETKNIIADLYKVDIEYFGYTFSDV